LDLFKFYVEDLKSKFNDEKRIIKEIMKVCQFALIFFENYWGGIPPCGPAPTQCPPLIFVEVLPL
jgi:hypothetical protein